MSSLNFEAQRSHCVLDRRNVALVAHYCRPTEVSGIMCVPTPQRACDTLRLGLALLVDVDVGNHCIDDRQRVQQLPLLPSQEVRMVRKPTFYQYLIGLESLTRSRSEGRAR